MYKHNRVQTPRPQEKRKRIPMRRVVKRCVNKWSDSYLTKAKKGHVASMLKVAELQHAGPGFGKIKYSPVQGKRWVEFAATHSNSVKAKEALRRLIVREEQIRDKLQHLQRYALTNGEHPSLAPSEYAHEPVAAQGATMTWAVNWNQYATKGKLSKMEQPDRDPLLDRVPQRQRTASLRLNPGSGEHSVPAGFPQIATRFELNYAVKSALDGKMQRKVTDPIPRPIYEYTMVSRTPAPEHVNGAAQAIHLVEIMKGDATNVKLDTALTGKTYVPEGSTIADTPMLATPVGMVNRFQHIVDAEIEANADMLYGAGFSRVDGAAILDHEYRRSFWPTDTKSAMETTILFRKAYRDTAAEQEKSGLRYLNDQDDHEHHGSLVPHKPNPYLQELDERSDNDFQAIPAHMLYYGDDLFSDPEHEADNFRAPKNLGFEVVRRYNMPVDSPGVFPYNGLPRRNFFLSDPFHLMRPWLPVNADGTEQDDEPLPEPHTIKLKRNFLDKVVEEGMPKGPADLIPTPIPTQPHNLQQMAETLLDSFPGAPDSQVHRAHVDNWSEDERRQLRAYNPTSYLTPAQWNNAYPTSVSKFDPHDEAWLMDNDSLDVRVLPHTASGSAERQAQIKQLATRWLEVYHADWQVRTTPFDAMAYQSDGEAKENASLASRREKRLRYEEDKGKRDHADFALARAPDDLVLGEHEPGRTDSHLAFVSKRDVDIQLANDGHSRFEVADPHSYQQLGRVRPFHPADGSPRALDKVGSVYNNIMRYRKHFAEVLAGLTEPIPTQDENNGKIVFADWTATKAAVLPQLQERLSELLDKHNSPSGLPSVLASPGQVDNGSDDDERYIHEKPFVRPFVQTVGPFHPYWNRVVPNPAVFSPSLNQNPRVNAARRSYEASMWNEYASGKKTWQEAQHSVRAIDPTGTAGWDDPNRGVQYWADQSSDIDYEKPYSRQELDHKLATGRFVVARRDDVNVITQQPSAVPDLTKYPQYRFDKH